ncbi:MAG: hypothetical protein HY318_02275 [Armatimonadetes bacterium]|nr:hypothetical protein [Armatimonadota bacterium]
MPAPLRLLLLSTLIVLMPIAVLSQGEDEGYLPIKGAEGMLIKPLAFEVYRETRLNWGPFPEKSIVTTLGPDAILSVFRAGHQASMDQLESGRLTFIDGEMPLDFVMMLIPRNYDLTLYAGGDSKPFTEYLSAHVWYGGDGPDGQGVSLRVLGVGIPDRFGGWKRVIAEKKAVVLRSKEEGAMVRVRATLKKNVWTETKSPDGREDVRHLALSIRCALGKIPGNEELRDFLNSRHGRPPVVATQMVNFEFIRRKDVDKELELNYQMWRIRSAQPPKTPESQAQRVDAYQKILQLEPNHERTLIFYAGYLEEIGRLREAIEIAQKLAAAVQSVPRGRDPIEEIDGDKLQPATRFCSADHRKPETPDKLVAVLNQHIERLRRLEEGKQH